MTFREQCEQLFEALSDPDTAEGFWEHVASDVRWTVMGTHQLAGTYRDRDELRRATFDRLAPLMRDGVRLELEHLHLAGDIAIAELHAKSRTLEDAPFDNRYCWVCRFVGETIVEVRAYLDSAMVAYTVARNERRADRVERRASA